MMSVQIGEKEFLVHHLGESRIALENAVTSVDNETWSRIPGDGQWSISQCAEHVVNVEQRVMGLIEKLRDLPAEPFELSDMQRKDQTVLSVAMREVRVQAPPAVHPTAKYGTPQEMITAFRDSRAKFTSLAEEYPDWLRGRFFEHPVLKKLDGYQWILVCSCHALRHTAQIEEVKDQMRP